VLNAQYIYYKYCSIWIRFFFKILIRCITMFSGFEICLNKKHTAYCYVYNNILIINSFYYQCKTVNIHIILVTYFLTSSDLPCNKLVNSYRVFCKYHNHKIKQIQAKKLNDMLLQFFLPCIDDSLELMTWTDDPLRRCNSM